MACWRALPGASSPEPGKILTHAMQVLASVGQSDNNPNPQLAFSYKYFAVNTPIVRLSSVRVWRVLMPNVEVGIH